MTIFSFVVSDEILTYVQGSLFECTFMVSDRQQQQLALHSSRRAAVLTAGAGAAPTEARGGPPPLSQRPAIRLVQAPRTRAECSSGPAEPFSCLQRDLLV